MTVTTLYNIGDTVVYKGQSGIVATWSITQSGSAENTPSITYKVNFNGRFIACKENELNV